jgi:hypothetical protein
MGPFLVALPRKTYAGAFATDVSLSKLIPAADVDTDLLASQIAGRLSQQLQMAVFVSCSFDDHILGGAVLEPLLLRQRTVPLAEQRICQLLTQHHT